MKFIGSILKELKQIFPPYLTLLVLTPVIIGFFIDYDLSDGRYFMIDLFWLLLFTVPYILTKKRIIYLVANIIYFLIGLLEISHWVILKGPLTLTSFFAISNTNLRETLEFFDLKASFGLLILIPYVALFLYSVKHPPQIFQSKVKPYVIGVLVMIAAIFLVENALNGRLVRKGTPIIAKVVFSYFDQMKLYKEVMKVNVPKDVDATLNPENRCQTFILIIGESANRNHMSLYGAKRNTNPRLGSRKDLYIFKNVVSHYSNTIDVVLSILTKNGLADKNINNNIDLLDVFHSAGFKTYWISNQSPIGIWDNIATVYAKKSDYFKFVNTTSNSAFEAILTSSYDSKLFRPFSKIMQEKDEKKFIVVHLMGCHAIYSKRYPSEFNVFKGEGDKEKTIAQYDNSLVYNDFIVDSLLKMAIAAGAVQEQNITSIIYLSDHGENVYDEFDKVGHDFNKKLPKSNVEVLFIVWISPSYKQLFPDKMEAIQSNLDKPFVTDYLFHSILDLNGISAPFLEPEKSIFNKRYNDKRKRILEDGFDYDQ